MDVLTRMKLRNKRWEMQDAQRKYSKLQIEWHDVAQNCDKYEEHGVCAHSENSWSCSYVTCPMLD